jgi:hypothetical protein
MVELYCGNNSRDVQLLSGNQVLGTRNGCLRKGIGKGLQLPYDSKYAGDYLPIDNRKIYCGNENIAKNVIVKAKQRNLCRGCDKTCRS